MTLDIQDTAVPVRDERYRVERLPCCYFLKDEHDRTLFTLNNTSVLVWGLCTGEWNVGDIVVTLEESFPESRDRIREDVLGVLREFRDHEVIRLDAT